MLKMKIAVLIGAVGIFLNALTTALMAISLGFGASGAGTLLDVTGKETLKQDSAITNHQIQQTLFVPSLYLQVTVGEKWFGDKDGFVIGVERIPGTHEIGAEQVTRSDLRINNATSTVQNYAQAELSDHWTVYIETPGFSPLGIFLKAAYTDVTVTTNEALGTGAEYGNQSINAKTVGGGFKGTHESGISIKIIYEYTDYDNISIDSTGSDASSTVTADADSSAVKFSVGYNF